LKVYTQYCQESHPVLDKVLTHVPGTVILDEETARNDLVAGLKHATGKNAHIVLAPQPSEDPNDPLNWPRWQRDTCFCLLLLSSVLCPSVNAPLLNTSFVLIAEHFNQSIAEVVKVGSGYVLLVTGASGYLPHESLMDLTTKVPSIAPYRESSESGQYSCSQSSWRFLELSSENSLTITGIYWWLLVSWLASASARTSLSSWRPLGLPHFLNLLTL
jgi:hypothetical protein